MNTPESHILTDAIIDCLARARTAAGSDADVMAGVDLVTIEIINAMAAAVPGFDAEAFGDAIAAYDRRACLNCGRVGVGQGAWDAVRYRCEHANDQILPLPR